MRTINTDLLAKRVLFCFVLVFEMCSLRLCAEDVTPAKAQVMRESFVSEAKTLVGAPYVYGAVGPDSFDCSGLIYYAARKSVQIQLPRTAKAIYNYCKVVPDKDREIGDLLFFKTTSSDSISHVGIYIGNNQFISAISDGPNTGVIVSSLKQDYWKPKYVCTGKFLKSGISNDVIEEDVKPETPKSTTTTKADTTAKASAPDQKKTVKDFKGSSFRNLDGSIAENVIFDCASFFDWSLFTPNEVMFRFRGVDIQTGVRYAKWLLEPGFDLALRINTSQKLFQMPLLFTATVNDYFKFYAGPVISFGHGCLVGSDKEIKASFFPGIIGLSLSTPAIEAGSTKIQVVQDISYTIFNNTDNSALKFKESIGAGLVMYTGIRVSFPLNIFMSGK